MKKILLLLLFSTVAQANEISLLKEQIFRVDSLMQNYAKEVHPLLERFIENRRTIFDRDERKAIQDFWTVYNDTRIALEVLKSSHEGKNELIVFSANLHLQTSAAILSQKLWNNELAQKKLNETNTAEIPRGSFINLENQLFNSIHNGMEQLPTYFPSQALSLVEPIVAEDTELQAINEAAIAQFKKLEDFVESKKNYQTVRKRFQIYKFKNVFYTIMRKISTWLGDTKTRNRDPDYYNGKTAITIEQAKEMQAKLQPGDIMISRTDWFLSNMFLPGFWSHSFIYTGDAKQLKAYFNNEDVNQHYLSKCQKLQLECDNFFDYLTLKFPTVINDYTKKDKYGYPNVLIEATSEGVHFSSIRHTFLNDYLAAARPMVSLLDKAVAIEQSLEFYGLEYDFDFDYISDDRLVCSELVGKSYDKSVEMNFDIDKGEYIEQIMQRLSIPVKNFAHKMYDENIAGRRKSELKFIAFLKGLPKQDRAVFSSEKEFYQTIEKKKWSFME